MIPVILTNRFKLIPPSKECFDIYERFYTDENASKMYGGPLTIEQAWARLKADLGSWFLLGYGVWVIQRTSDESFIGTCGFWKGNGWPRELTWWVLPEARGQGVATEVSKAVLSYAYEERNWGSVETYMNDENIAARSLVEKLGGIIVNRQLFPDGLSRNIYKIPAPN